MKKFKKIFIEITNACNLNCSYCSISDRKTENISIENFEHIISQIKPFSQYIYLHVKGEPFLHPELDSILKICNLNNIHVNITTNGTLINSVKDILLQSSALRQVNFSLHSFDLTQNTINKTESIINILEFSKEAIEKTRTIIALRLWNLEKLNLSDEKEKNEQIINLGESFFNLNFKIKDKLSAGNSIKLSERLYLNFDYQFQWPNNNDTQINEKGFCYALRDQAAILVDGTVVPCCLDSEGIINLGNIHLQPFEQIINSDRAKTIYTSFSNNKAHEELCKKCSYKNRFIK